MSEDSQRKEGGERVARLKKKARKDMNLVILFVAEMLGLEKNAFLEDGDRNPYKRRGENSLNIFFLR